MRMSGMRKRWGFLPSALRFVEGRKDDQVYKQVRRCAKEKAGHLAITTKVSLKCPADSVDDNNEADANLESVDNSSRSGPSTVEHVNVNDVVTIEKLERLIQERKAKAAEQKEVAERALAAELEKAAREAAEAAARVQAAKEALRQAEAATGLSWMYSQTPLTMSLGAVRPPNVMWTARPDLWLSSARTFAGMTRADAVRVTECMARLREISDYAPLDARRVEAHLEMLRSGGHDDLKWHIGIVYALEHLWVAEAHPLKFTAFKERMKTQYPGWVVDVRLIARRGDETMLEHISGFVSALV
ncbi:hypothetical protein DYB32_007202 [Aphanomyces invadans]|uniref:Uncharacterized protein n=1 Tax=Aphanomyces invadans TaxID=157072 RepID=A0A3R6Y504_9STRA|nr:hypothetical protein DYB32_007202 [Aphanomyces invadans]